MTSLLSRSYYFELSRQPEIMFPTKSSEKHEIQKEEILAIKVLSVYLCTLLAYRIFCASTKLVIPSSSLSIYHSGVVRTFQHLYISSARCSSYLSVGLTFGVAAFIAT